MAEHLNEDDVRVESVPEHMRRRRRVTLEMSADVAYELSNVLQAYHAEHGWGELSRALFRAADAVEGVKGDG